MCFAHPAGELAILFRVSSVSDTAAPILCNQGRRYAPVIFTDALFRQENLGVWIIGRTDCDNDSFNVFGNDHLIKVYDLVFYLIREVLSAKLATY
jgi:hypothetical protein